MDVSDQKKSFNSATILIDLCPSSLAKNSDDLFPMLEKQYDMLKVRENISLFSEFLIFSIEYLKIVNGLELFSGNKQIRLLALNSRINITLYDSLLNDFRNITALIHSKIFLNDPIYRNKSILEYGFENTIFNLLPTHAIESSDHSNLIIIFSANHNESTIKQNLENLPVQSQLTVVVIGLGLDKRVSEYDVSDKIKLKFYNFLITDLIDDFHQFIIETHGLSASFVSGIPMKEESSNVKRTMASISYDVPIIHHSFTSNTQDHQKSLVFSPNKLVWVNATVPAKDLILTSNHFVFTFLKPSSRQSACLVNFLLSGRVILVEDINKKNYAILNNQQRMIIYEIEKNQNFDLRPCSMTGENFPDISIFKLKIATGKSAVCKSENVENIEIFKEILKFIQKLAELDFDPEFLNCILAFFDNYFRSFEAKDYDSISNKMMEIILKIKKRSNSSICHADARFDDVDAFKSQIIDFVTNLKAFKPTITKYKNMFAQLNSNITTVLKNFITNHLNEQNPEQSNSVNESNQKNNVNSKRIIDNHEMAEDTLGPDAKVKKSGFEINKEKKSMLELWKEQMKHFYDNILRPLHGQVVREDKTTYKLYEGMKSKH